MISRELLCASWDAKPLGRKYTIWGQMPCRAWKLLEMPGRNKIVVTAEYGRNMDEMGGRRIQWLYYMLTPPCPPTVFYCADPSTCCRAIIPLTPLRPKNSSLMLPASQRVPPQLAGPRNCASCAPVPGYPLPWQASPPRCAPQSADHSIIARSLGVAVKSRAGKGCQSHKEEGGWHRLGYRSIRQNRPVQG